MCLLLALSLLATPATLSGHLAHAPAADSVHLLVGFRQLGAALSPAGDFRFTQSGRDEQVSIDADWAIQQLGCAHQHDTEAMPAGWCR